MVLNKYMHPRNIYKTPPDFEKLANLYPEFSKIAKMDVTGKVTIDFKDPHTLRVLTKCLLKSDFNLDIEIPEDRLVPTLPLRLNYILWIEDLMAAVQRNSEIQGIDIGTGACAVYPLLAAVKNKWYMIATETDLVSLQKAQENIQHNNLQHLIKLTNNEESKLIESLFKVESKEKFDFCMCNPPFYSNLQELYESRSPARLPPKNGFTGSPQELITDGGELKFCRTLIDESKRCKDQVLIFTTMVGHKYNLSELILDLKAEGIKHTHTEFCQGRVTRWGLAWTYQDHDIYHLVPPRDKARKKILPISHQLPPIPNCEYNMETTYSKIKALLSDLQIQQKVLNKCGKRIALDILARENTWSNQRRKRRLMKRMETADPKKFKLDTNHIESNVIPENVNDTVTLVSSDGSSSVENTDETNNVNECKLDSNESNNIPPNISNTDDVSKLISSNKLTTENMDTKAKTEQEKLKSDVHELDKFSQNNKEVKLSENRPTMSENRLIHPNKTANIHKSAENILSETKSEDTANSAPLIHAFMKLYKKDEIIQLDIEFIDGTGGKESVYQVVQYIKNNWK